MKKIVTEMRAKNLLELNKDIAKLRDTILKVSIEQKVNPAKDTNEVYKMRNRLAVMLTLRSEKIELEKLKKS